jgi:hypothetical protein
MTNFLQFSNKTLIICFVIVVFLIGAISYGIYVIFPNGRYENAYLKIEVGDSKEKVISLYGKSKKISNCSSKSYLLTQEEEFRCAEVYEYYGFFRAWGFVIDKDGIVLHKFRLAAA